MVFKKCPNCDMENPEAEIYCLDCGTRLGREKGPRPPHSAKPAEPEVSASAPESPSQPEESALPETVVEPPIEPPPAEPAASAPGVASAPAAVTALLALQTPPAPALVALPGPSQETALSTAAEPTEAEAAVPPAGPIPTESGQPGPATEPSPGELASQPESPPAPPLESAPPESPPGPPAEASPPEPEPPSPPFGERFKVLEVIGTGATGTVYKVFDIALDRELALKAIRPDFAERPEAFEGFSRELRVERGIVHKNIARLFELNVEKGKPFITMEFVAGQTLEALLKEKKGPLPVDRAVGLAVQLTKGLAELHRRGVSLLNLRPRHITVDKEGTPKIMDLGLSRWLMSKGFAVADLDDRTSPYLSPEAAAGRNVDFRSDIYSLGVIFYEMITGVVPSEPETPAGASGEEAGEMPRNPLDLNPFVPPMLGLIILKCIARDPDDRYQSADDLVTDLEGIEARPEPETARALPGSLKGQPDRPPAGPGASKTEPQARPAPAPKPAVESRVRKSVHRGLPTIPAGAVRISLIALAVIVVGAVVWRLASRPGRPAPVEAAPSNIIVAVLPFTESGPARSREHFGEGLAETLIDGVNRLPGIRLTSAASHSGPRSTNPDSAQIARKTGAGFTLTGTFEAADTRLLVTAQLIKAGDGSKVWEDRFERAPEDLSGILQDVAGGLVRAAGITAPAAEFSALFKSRPYIPEALDLYFRGRSLAARGGRESLEKAIEAYEQAAVKDPAWADVHACLANAHIDLGSGSLREPEKAFPAARKAVLKALELEPGLTEARLAMAFLKWRSEWDFEAAEKEFREALRLDPGRAETRRSLALFLSSLGRHEEAQSEMRAAMALDPASPRMSAGLGMVLYFARLYDQAAVELAKARDAGPADFEPCLGLGLLHIQTGDFAESIRMFQMAAVKGGDPREMSLRIGIVLAHLGRRPEVGQILTDAMQASRQTYVSSVSLAAVYAGLLEPDQAQACLEKAYADRDASLVFLRISPLFDPVRSRPWFTELLGKIGLSTRP